MFLFHKDLELKFIGIPIAHISYMMKKNTIWQSTFLFIATLWAVGCGQTPTDSSSQSSSSSIPAATELSALGSSTSIAVSWKNPDFSSPYYVRVQYRESGTDEFAVAGTVTSKTEFTIEDLNTSQDYDIRLQTITQDGSASNYSDVVKATTILKVGQIGGVDVTLAQVSNLKVVYNDYNSTQITWNWSETTPTDTVSSYEISRKRQNEMNWTQIYSSTSIVASQSYKDTSPQSSVLSYLITVHYKDDAKSSANFQSNTINYNVTTVVGLTAAYNNYNSVKVGWSWSSSDVTSIASFDVYREKFAETTWTKIANVTSVATPSYTDVPSATTVKYQIIVNYKDSTTKTSTMASSVSYALPAVNKPAVAAVTGHLQVTWSWTNTTDYDVISQYKVERSPSTANPLVFTTLSTLTAVNPMTTTYTDASVGNDDGAFIYRIEVNYKSGATTSFSPNSDAKNVPVPTPLPAPTSASSSLYLSSDFRVLWSYGTNVTNASMFTVQWSVLDTNGSFYGSGNSYVEYSSSQSAYSAIITAANTACASPSADTISFKIQATPADYYTNIASAWTDAGTLSCGNTNCLMAEQNGMVVDGQICQQ